MTGAPLTPGRRAQLAALLDDDGATLQARFPQVADYLATVERLAASGDSERGAAFDVSLLHHMTGTDSPNPYWAIVANMATTGPDGRRVIDSGDAGTNARLHLAQDLLQGAYAYAIPSPESLRWVAAMSKARPVVEIGAGRGYWAHQLARLGVDVHAYDRHPPGDDDRNTWFTPVSGLPSQWQPVEGFRHLAAATQAARRSGKRAQHVLLLCWPPSWGHPMASNALAAYERMGGDRLIYIGDQGTRCADERFFDRLSQGWELAEEDDAYVRWWNLEDTAQCWVRK